SANDNRCQGTLHLRTRCGRDRHREKPKSRNGCGSNYRSKANQSATNNQFIQREPAFLLELIEIAHQDDAVQHGDTEQCDKANASRNAERQAANPKRKHTTDGRQWHRGKNEQRIRKRTECKVQQHQDQEQGYWNGNDQPIFRPLEIFKVAAITNIISTWKVKPRVQLLLYLLNEAFDIASPYIYSQRNSATRIVAGNLRW